MEITWWTAIRVVVAIIAAGVAYLTWYWTATDSGPEKPLPLPQVDDDKPPNDDKPPTDDKPPQKPPHLPAVDKGPETLKIALAVVGTLVVLVVAFVVWKKRRDGTITAPGAKNAATTTATATTIAPAAAPDAAPDGAPTDAAPDAAPDGAPTVTAPNAKAATAVDDTKKTQFGDIENGASDIQSYFTTFANKYVKVNGKPIMSIKEFLKSISIDMNGENGVEEWYIRDAERNVSDKLDTAVTHAKGTVGNWIKKVYGIDVDTDPNKQHPPTDDSKLVARFLLYLDAIRGLSQPRKPALAVDDNTVKGLFTALYPGEMAAAGKRFETIIEMPIIKIIVENVLKYHTKTSIDELRKYIQYHDLIETSGPGLWLFAYSQNWWTPTLKRWW